MLSDGLYKTSSGMIYPNTGKLKSKLEQISVNEHYILGLVEVHKRWHYTKEVNCHIRTLKYCMKEM